MTTEMRGDDRVFLCGPRGRLARSRSTVCVVDLFSGCGGLTLGVQEAARTRGYETDVRLAVELDEKVAAVYGRNFGVPSERLARDVVGTFDGRHGRPFTNNEKAAVALVGRKLDILVGGPPCQGHSTLNNHTRGDDPKNRLYLAMVRAAEVLAPRVVVVENVPPVERDSGRVLDKATGLFERLGYAVDADVVSVADIGVPQLRKRHVLVASRGSSPRIREAVLQHSVKGPRDLRWAIGDLRGARRSPLDEPSVLTKENLKRARYLLRTQQFDLPNRMRPPCQRGAHKYKSMYGRLRWDAPAQTITTGFGSPGQGRYLHPQELRTLTSHEAARIQFFPDWFDFSGLYRTELARVIGNAVPPKLAFVLASAFIDFERAAR